MTLLMQIYSDFHNIFLLPRNAFIYPDLRGFVSFLFVLSENFKQPWWSFQSSGNISDGKNPTMLLFDQWYAHKFLQGTDKFISFWENYACESFLGYFCFCRSFTSYNKAAEVGDETHYFLFRNTHLYTVVVACLLLILCIKRFSYEMNISFLNHI